MKNKMPWLILGIVFALIAALVLFFLLGMFFMTVAIRTLFGSVDGQQIDGSLTSGTVKAYAFMAVAGVACAGVSILGFTKGVNRKDKGGR
ncbi:MAG: hypothetical protein PHP22_10145 [Oscillospiraceae bacterium]|nr:hypothetical protein [Oscillospiraceae bacterium]